MLNVLFFCFHLKNFVRHIKSQTGYSFLILFIAGVCEEIFKYVCCTSDLLAFAINVLVMTMYSSQRYIIFK